MHQNREVNVAKSQKKLIVNTIKIGEKSEREKTTEREVPLCQRRLQ